MLNSKLSQLSQDYYRIEKALKYIQSHADQQPALPEIATRINLSEYHFQRLFSRWTGISPKRFLQYVTKEYAKQLLKGSQSVLDTAYDVGLSSGGRLHDLFIACEAVTPGQYKRAGEGLEIHYGSHPSPFGRCAIAATERGICYLEFLMQGNKPPVINGIKKRWPNAKIVKQEHKVRKLIQRIFNFEPEAHPAPLHLHVKGTNFQIKVWEALLKIPLGKVVTYEDVARHIGMPNAARAVGNAVGQNPIPFLIPCHRVIKKMGIFGNYGGGRERKKAILGWEAARHERYQTKRQTISPKL